MVMAYIDVISTETGEDRMVLLREVFECLREAGFKMRVAKCDFMKSEIKYLGHVVSAEGIKPVPKAVSNCAIGKYPRTRQSCKAFWASPIIIASIFLGMPNFWPPCKLLPAWVRPSPGGDEKQQFFNVFKLASIEAAALAQPEREFVLATNASALAISGILHQWQGPPGAKRQRQIVYRSKKLNATKAKYGAPKLEMYAAFYFILENHSSYLCARKFMLRVDIQALSWLKT